MAHGAMPQPSEAKVAGVPFAPLVNERGETRDEVSPKF